MALHIRDGGAVGPGGGGGGALAHPIFPRKYRLS